MSFKDTLKDVFTEARKRGGPVENLTWQYFNSSSDFAPEFMKKIKGSGHEKQANTVFHQIDTLFDTLFDIAKKVDKG